MLRWNHLWGSLRYPYDEKNAAKEITDSILRFAALLLNFTYPITSFDRVATGSKILDNFGNTAPLPSLVRILCMRSSYRCLYSGSTISSGRHISVKMHISEPVTQSLSTFKIWEMGHHRVRE